jgi:hypothetical protein
MTRGINKQAAKLRKAPQPPLSHAGALPDSDRGVHLKLRRAAAVLS